MNRPATVLETGTNHGLSTIVLAQALKDTGESGMVHTIEFDASLVDIARRNVEAAGLSRFVTFYTGDSVTAIKDLAQQGLEFDFVFLDAGHSYREVMDEFKAVRPRVGKHAIVYFDNTQAGGVAAALRAIARRYAGDLVEFPSCSWGPPGNAVWQPRRRFRTRSWRS